MTLFSMFLHRHECCEPGLRWYVRLQLLTPDQDVSAHWSAAGLQHDVSWCRRDSGCALYGPWCVTLFVLKYLEYLNFGLHVVLMKSHRFH